MKYSEVKKGRIFILRLEDGDIVHEKIETFAKENQISAATLTALGGVDKGSILVTGPEEGRTKTILPMTHVLDNVYEAAGTGTIFPDGSGTPVLHMHLACGRKGKTVTGCIRNGVKVWHVLEVVVTELTHTTGIRKKDAATGFDLLVP